MTDVENSRYTSCLCVYALHLLSCMCDSGSVSSLPFILLKFHLIYLTDHQFLAVLSIDTANRQTAIY